MKRMAHGFRDMEFFKLKIMASMSDQHFLSKKSPTRSRKEDPDHRSAGALIFNRAPRGAAVEDTLPVRH